MRSNSWANQQKDGDSAVRMIVQGLLEKNRRKRMDRCRLLNAVDNHAAVKIGSLEKGARSKNVVKPRFATDFPGAVIPEGVDDVRLRADEEGVLRTFINTTNVGNKRWSAPLVDEDWHALCQAMFHGVEGPEEAMSYRYEDVHQSGEKQDI